MRMIWSNLLYAARNLARNAGFSLTVILVLGLGIGSNAGIFSVLNGVLLRPLPYADPERLMLLIGNIQRNIIERRGASLPDYLDWKEQNHSFDRLAAYWNATLTLNRIDERVQVQTEVIGSQYFDVLGIQPLLGRAFRPEEETDSSLAAAAVVSYNFWAERLASDSSALGTTISLNAATYTIVGIMPRGFHGLGDRADVWITPASPLGSEQGLNFRERGTRGANVIGRLRAGVTVQEAQADLDAVSKNLERVYAENQSRGVEVVPLVEETFGSVRPALLFLFGAVGLVLLIACANVANIVLVRMETRGGEMAIRAALGASRGQLIHLILAENLLLSALGGALGLLMSARAVDLILAWSPIQLPSFVTTPIDGTVFLFTIGVALLTGILVTIAPALHFAASNLNEKLTSSSAKTTSTRSAHRFRGAMIAGEVALSFVLLVSAGLLIESFRHLLRVDPGFQTSHLLALQVGLENTSLSAAALRDALSTVAGARSVTLSSDLPFNGGPRLSFMAEGQSDVDTTNVPRAYFHRVAPGFFRTMGIPLLHGRDFTLDDRSFFGEDGDTVIVSEKVANRFWSDGTAVGKRIKHGTNDPNARWLTIIGVVGETRSRGLPENPTADPDLYYPLARNARTFGVLIRTAVAPESLIPSVRHEIRTLDKLALVTDVMTMDERIAPRTARFRFLSGLSGFFAALALVLVLVGVYGAMSYTVVQRTREIGIRVAIGARRLDIFQTVLLPTLVPLGIGLMLGMAASVFLRQTIAVLLFGVRPLEPFIFIAVSLLVVLTGLAAAFIPARRAAEVDPIRALRQE